MRDQAPQARKMETLSAREIRGSRKQTGIRPDP